MNLREKMDLVNSFYRKYINLIRALQKELNLTEEESINFINIIIKEIIIEEKNISVKKYEKKIRDKIKNFDKFLKSYKLNVNNKILGEVFEKLINKKEIGAYYTPIFLTKYITTYSIYLYFLKKLNLHIRFRKENLINLSKIESEFYKILNDINFKKKVINILENFKIFDPTCGSGNFIFSALSELKQIYKKLNLYISDAEIIKKHLFGNDIDKIALDLLFFRFELYFHENNIDKTLLVKIYENFTNNDFLESSEQIKFQCILGNPPYFELNKNNKEKFQKFKTVKCGNIYSLILEKSFNYLDNKGIMGMVIPISFVSTIRMKYIRNYLLSQSSNIYIASFADRPSSLFVGVHQKINLLFVEKENVNLNKFYTTSYIHFNKHEFSFDSIKKLNYISNKYKLEYFLPKIGNKIEDSIFDKVINEKTSLLSLKKSNGQGKLYINQRLYLWVKTFTKKLSSEYKIYYFKDDKTAKMIGAILNSNLFFIFWEIVSDGWHLTNKELELFSIPNINENLKKRLVDLYLKLEKELEEKKEFIETKQARYAYKHNKCYDIIQNIDKELIKAFNFSDEEKKYILNYRNKYVKI